MSELDSLVWVAGASRVAMLLIITVCVSTIGNVALCAFGVAWRGRAVTPIWAAIAGMTWSVGSAACAALVLMTQAAWLSGRDGQESGLHIGTVVHLRVVRAACGAFLLMTLIGTPTVSLLTRAREPLLRPLFACCGAVIVLATSVALHGMPTVESVGLPPEQMPVICFGALALGALLVIAWRFRASPVSRRAVLLSIGWLLAGVASFALTRDIAHDARIIRRWPPNTGPYRPPPKFVLSPGTRCAPTEMEAVWLSERNFMVHIDSHSQQGLTEELRVVRQDWHWDPRNTNYTVDVVRMEAEPRRSVAELLWIVEAIHHAGYRRIRMVAYEAVETPTKTVGVERHFKRCEAQLILDTAGVDPLHYATWEGLYAAANAAPLILAIKPPPPDPDE